MKFDWKALGAFLGAAVAGVAAAIAGRKAPPPTTPPEPEAPKFDDVDAEVDRKLEVRKEP